MKQRSENNANPGTPRGPRRDRALLASLLACLLISLLACLAAGAASLRLLPARVQAGGVSHLAADYGRWQSGVLELDIARLATAVGRGAQDWQPRSGAPAPPAMTPTAGPPPTARPTVTPHRSPSPTSSPEPPPGRSQPTVAAAPTLPPVPPPSPTPEAPPLPPTTTPLPPAPPDTPLPATPAATALAVPTDAPLPTAATSTPSAMPTTMPTAYATPDPKKVNPIFECLDANEDGTYTAHWGYDNPNAGAVFIPSDLSLNFFSPAPRDRGQPTLFEPGRRVDVFTVTFEGNDLVWVLNSSAVARWNSQRCDASTPASTPTPSPAPEDAPTPTSTASPTPSTPAP